MCLGLLGGADRKGSRKRAVMGAHKAGEGPWHPHHLCEIPGNTVEHDIEHVSMSVIPGLLFF